MCRSTLLSRSLTPGRQRARREAVKERDVWLKREAARKLAAMQLRDAITAETTAVVRKLGGDAETGGQYLDPPQPLQLFGNKLRNIRLPKGSKAADMMPEEFCAEIERMYQSAMAAGHTPAVANAALESLRSALRPRDADEAPVPSPARARAVAPRPRRLSGCLPSGA